MKTITFLLLLVLNIVDSKAQSVITEPFDNHKWNNSSEYRYDLALRSFDILYEVIDGRSEKEIINSLGKPFGKARRTKNPAVHLKQGWTTVDTVIDLTYCLNVGEENQRTDTLKLCNGSYTVFHLFKDSLVDVTIVNVEPEIKPKPLEFDNQEFYLSGWLHQFPDTINVYTSFNQIPKGKSYSHLKIKNKNRYELYMWTGEIGLETPVQLKKKLRIKFYKDKMIFILGNKRNKYLKKSGNNKIKLIKNSANKDSK
jgi:hypothetical protein